jgi:hypothetical protein
LLTNANVIDLPDYWVGLVDSDTITVQLTPIGSDRGVYVESIQNNQITIGAATSVDCFYVVFGERKDVDKLIVEETA